ncbi:type II toxin-antitoxin system YoeB family toxin [Paenibacillus sp. FSL M7-0420]|uniref:type II toxin-antitoxin system YoeB family toxin n=1 Tax=Paenibacillus sp. FSL M7-0420 TaxID=2921609 RepID=UPI0030F6F9C5
MGKPEVLRGDFSGYWSRRFDDTSRLVYRIQSAIPRIELLMQKKAQPLQRWGLAMGLIRDTDDIFSAAPA